MAEIAKAYRVSHKNRAIELALHEAGGLITGIDGDTQKVIQLILARSISESWTQHQLYVQMKQVIGLSPRQVGAIDQMRVSLKKQGYTPSKVNARVKAYSNKLHRQRAMLVAKHEKRVVMERAKVADWGVRYPTSKRKTRARAGCCPRCRKEDGVEHDLNDPRHLPPFHPQCHCESVRVEPKPAWETEPVNIEKSIVVTPGGRVGNDSPFSRSKTSNWVAREGGLPKYVRIVARGLMKDGRSESQAIGMAIGILKNWASGQGDVSPKVRAAAVAAIAEWNAKKAKSKLDNKDHDSSKHKRVSKSDVDFPTLPEDMIGSQAVEFLKTVKLGRSIDVREFVKTPSGSFAYQVSYVKFCGIISRDGSPYVQYSNWGEDKTIRTAPARRVLVPQTDIVIEENDND